MDEELYYLQDSRDFVGNNILWWAKDGKGYTTDISKAHVYSKEDADKLHDQRGTERVHMELEVVWSHLAGRRGA